MHLQTDDLIDDFSRNVAERKWQMIREWKQSNANPPIKQLYDALKNNGRADLAEKLYQSSLEVMTEKLAHLELNVNAMETS